MIKQLCVWSIVKSSYAMIIESLQWVCQKIPIKGLMTIHQYRYTVQPFTIAHMGVTCCCSRQDNASRYDPSQNMGTMATKTLVRHPWNASAEVSAVAPDFPAISLPRSLL
jgi:hypothetical protein